MRARMGPHVRVGVSGCAGRARRTHDAPQSESPLDSHSSAFTTLQSPLYPKMRDTASNKYFLSIKKKPKKKSTRNFVASISAEMEGLGSRLFLPFHGERDRSRENPAIFSDSCSRQVYFLREIVAPLGAVREVGERKNEL